jgi:thiol-disulfide isomerase/thioredoxin/protocatechuate 3,4-dioxygenase beta subunit
LQRTLENEGTTMQSMADVRLAAAVALLCLFSCHDWTTHAASAAPAAELGRVVIHALDEQGQPLAGVTVTQFRFDQNVRRWKSNNRAVNTDERGVARFDALRPGQSYFFRVAGKDGLLGFKDCGVLDKNANLDLDAILSPSQTATIQVRDAQGRPIAGATTWSIKHSGQNGSITLTAATLDMLDVPLPVSVANGQLLLPGLPAGKIDVHLIHAEYAPAKIAAFTVGPQAAVEAVLEPGVKLTLEIDADAATPTPHALSIDLRHEPFDSPSTLIGDLPNWRGEKTAQLTVAVGKYSWLRLTHPDFLVLPSYSSIYGSSVADKDEPMKFAAGNDLFTFKIVPKVTLSGRVVDETTGKPLADQSIRGQVAAQATGPMARFATRWTHADWAETHPSGRYHLKVAPGPVQISFNGQGFISQSEKYLVDVAADGSTEAPDILVRLVPKIHGTVLDEAGQPLARAVVRFRGSMLAYYVMPVATDDEGHFDLSPPWIPVNLKTHDREPAQTIVAFDPYRPLAAEAQVRLDDAASTANVVLRMRSQDYGSTITAYPADLNEWQRGIMPADQKEHLSAISLGGKPAPELDGMLWLNSDKPNTSLADFRGKYVLLQFWTTWCGPCHSDLPSVKLAYDLYKDKGLVVVGFHDNSMPIDAIKQDVLKEGLNYPIVVDHSDGRILARYKEHGISGYTSYLLLDPDGKVIYDDTTIAAPALRSFKIELIRNLVMGGPRQGL